MSWFRPHRTIPHTPWRASHTFDLSFSRVLILFSGLFFFGIGEAFIVQSHIGNSPWVVFAEGVSEKTGLSLGWATFFISCVVLLFWIPLKQKPGIGTFANIIVIAASLQLGVDHIPLQKDFFSGVIFAALGVICVGVASSIYITCGLGPGPRDGLMAGLHLRSGVRVARVRMSIEIIVVAIGFALGGQVGLGTLIFALFVGQALAISLGVIASLTRQ